MNYFSHCTTLEDVKATYRELAKANHPDIGGSTATMQEINKQYAYASAKCRFASNPEMTDKEFASAASVDEILRQAIYDVINFDDVTIEVCGLWLWLHGSTFAVKDELKRFGFKWAPKKKLWYFPGVQASNRRGEYSLDSIRMRYGSQFVEKDDKQQRIS